MSAAEPVNILDADNREDFRRWLDEHASSEPECWVALRRGRGAGDGEFRYLDAVEEALCFGWIDSTLKRIGGTAFQRFAPRRKGSAWSERNKERCRRLERLGRMTDAGRAVLPDMSPEGFEIDDEVMAALRSDTEVWGNFLGFPPLYRRVRIDTIQIKKSLRPVFESRLAKFIENTRRNIMYGEWNDGGRLG